METELQQRNLIRRIWSHVSSYFQFSAPNVNESSRSGAHAGGKQWYRYSGFQKKARREIVQRFSAAQQSAVFASLAAKVFFCFLSILLVCQNHVSLLPGMSTKCVCAFKPRYWLLENFLLLLYMQLSFYWAMFTVVPAILLGVLLGCCNAVYETRIQEHRKRVKAKERLECYDVHSVK